MSKVAQYLQEHLVGEVMTSPDARDYFSTDGSIFKLTPQIIVYPRAENDVRKAARFSWQLAERGRAISLTARGSGTDQGGAAIGSGIMIVFPAHMNKIVTLDSNKGVVVIQPGINYGKLQQALQTHGLFLPPFPASLEYSTVGGAIANNAAGEKSVKYGDTKEFVKNLRVVLANGEVITTGRISKKDLNKKKGLATFEGEIYRTIDGIITDNQDLIDNNSLNVSKNTSGYDLWSIKQKDGSFDLTPLFVGSQGTLGIVTEAKLETESYNPKKTLLVGYFSDVNTAAQAIAEIKKHEPSALEMVDDNLLNFLHKHQPSLLGAVTEQPYPKIMVLVEFDDPLGRVQKKKVKRTQKILEKVAAGYKMATDEHDQEDLWKIRHSAAAVLWQNVGNKKAVPIIEDGIVPMEKFNEYINGVYALFEQFGLDAAIWGHAGDANIHMQPFLDLSQLGDRQKAFKLIDAYHKLVISLGGSTSGEHNDGRLRAPYLKELYGDQMYEVFRSVKQCFDPYNTLNPGVKIDVTLQDVQPLVRHEYSLKHLYDHMPRT